MRWQEENLNNNIVLKKKKIFNLYNKIKPNMINTIYLFIFLRKK